MSARQKRARWHHHWLHGYNWHDRPEGHAHLSALRAREERNDADQRLRARLRVHGMRHGTPAQARGLLRLLLLWVEPMPASAAWWGVTMPTASQYIAERA